MRSVYRWQGAVEHADEWLCLVKTTNDHYAAVEAAIRELHSYDCPEVIATPIVAGSAGVSGVAERTMRGAARRPLARLRSRQADNSLH